MSTGSQQQSLPEDDPVRFLQRYFGANNSQSAKKSGAIGAKVHPNFIMNKLDKQYKKE